ncbi:MAG: proton-conducting transporter membrane subunit [Lachnospira sp.]|nr:proton-conducting transporter membrane subunit [Lachnospira sp.]
MELLVTLLIGVPFAIAAVLAIVKNDWLRGKIVYLGGLLIAILAVVTAAMWYTGKETVTFNLPGTEALSWIVLAGDFFLMFLVIWLSIKHHKTIICVLSIVQTLMVAWVELMGPDVSESAHMRIDWLAFMMILIIGVIGVLIGIYAVGYMRGYHVHHKEFQDRRNFFFAIIFVFYGAMFGLVTSMNILWLDFFWETTSVCSFLLIGYTKTEEAVDNSFRALWMNLLGGLGIAIAIVYAAVTYHTVNLYDIVANGVAVAGGADKAALIPIAMLAFAALTKSAQMPFSQWLLGAMVAPTPSSALLHSATMVKAGVYMLLRIAIAMNGNFVGQMVYIIGGFTFFVTSLMAIAQNDAKKVLAYSTISNLGLITACAGVGMEETIWAAVFLIIFHAVSKSMLFQCVGAIENTTGSRDIEDMQGLVLRYPKLGLILMIGIAGMFLAPFGMLVSKWAALRAFVDAPSTFLVVCIVFGSATTMFYWTKWLAKILGVGIGGREDITQNNEYGSMFLHAAMIILLCLSFPLVSNFFVEPLVTDMFGYAVSVIDAGSVMIMVIMVLGVFIVPLVSYLLTRNVPEKEVLAYMGGANAGDNIHFIDAFGEEKDLKVSNWYLRFTFGARKLFMPSVIFTTVIIVLFISLIVGGALR